ncbi:uncharacterized protein LOC133814132 [Humulus lupulus]|uniref:uncharacterized protein LOC133814132 n=1 Tax=Humulus lupulus TaxID=3486 RepID=UPI002B40A36B|nr:uncharacterized protein LOC133814132 [Humulus lupulus]
MAWNIRGLNNPKKQVEIKQLIWNMKIGVVGLLETRVKTQKLGEVYIRMFSGWCFSSNNAWLRSNNGHEGFLVTFIYAFNDANGREILWRDLKILARDHKQPWVVLGDFNDILNADERVGKRVQGGSSSAFQDCIEECQLEDVKYSSCFFTWTKKQDKEGIIYSKIDRVMANQEWLIQHELVEKLKRLKAVLRDINKKGFNNIQVADTLAYQELKRKQECLNKDPLNE